MQLLNLKITVKNLDPNKTILWVGTNEGLNKLLITNSINQNKKLKIIVEITNYSIEDGLADKSINAILEATGWKSMARYKFRNNTYLI